MKRLISYIVTLGVITSITLFSSITSRAETDSSVLANTSMQRGAEPYAAASNHVYKNASKSKSTSYGIASVDYKFSGNYTYHLSSGEILSAYGAQLDDFTFNPPPASNEAPNPDFWDSDILDIRLTQSVIDKGGRAKYTVSFTLKATSGRRSNCNEQDNIHSSNGYIICICSLGGKTYEES
ncbi:hypothetical protein AALB39_18235 [Lachnospiraceae bacterium 54-53]